MDFTGKRKYVPPNYEGDVDTEEFRKFGQFFIDLANKFDKLIENHKLEIEKLQKNKTIHENNYQRSDVRIILDIMDELKESTGKNIPFEEVLRRTNGEGIKEPNKI